MSELLSASAAADLAEKQKDSGVVLLASLAALIEKEAGMGLMNADFDMPKSLSVWGREHVLYALRAAGYRVMSAITADHYVIFWGPPQPEKGEGA